MGVWGVGFRVQGTRGQRLWVRGYGLGFGWRRYNLGFSVQGLGFRV